MNIDLDNTSDDPHPLQVTPTDFCRVTPRMWRPGRSLLGVSHLELRGLTDKSE